MKTISMKASAMPKSAGLESVKYLVNRFKLHIGVAGAALSFLGCMADSQTVIYIGAAVALAAVRKQERKGGMK